VSPAHHDSDAPPPPQRVSPITFPTEAPSLPKPAEDAPRHVRDAYRETTFAVRADLDWLLAAFQLQRDIVEASYPSKYRNHRYAAALLPWSRVYVTGLECFRLTAQAVYGPVPPLIRATLEWLGAEQAVVGSEHPEFLDWLRDAFQPESAHSAVDVGMGQYMAGQQIAQSDDLGPIYRAASELARPHFGPAALLTAPESNRQKLAVHWADQSFHLGWAQLLFGWQITIQDRQLRFAVGRDLFAVGAETRERFHDLHRRADPLLAAPGRCHAEWTETDRRQRLLIHHFRRQPSGAPRNYLL
jgi:hypothetical protein